MKFFGRRRFYVASVWTKKEMLFHCKCVCHLELLGWFGYCLSSWLRFSAAVLMCNSVRFWSRLYQPLIYSFVSLHLTTLMAPCSDRIVSCVTLHLLKTFCWWKKCRALLVDLMCTEWR